MFGVVSAVKAEALQEIREMHPVWAGVVARPEAAT